MSYLLSYFQHAYYLSSFALISIAKVSDIGVMASLAVFSLSSSAPAIIVVSSCVNSPPFPAYYRVTSDIRAEKRSKEVHISFKRNN